MISKKKNVSLLLSIVEVDCNHHPTLFPKAVFMLKHLKSLYFVPPRGIEPLCHMR